MTPTGPITIIGGGLAGCEAAWQAAARNCRVVLHEMKPSRFSPAHTSPDLAELVCSNSLRAADVESAVGLPDELTIEPLLAATRCVAAAQMMALRRGVGAASHSWSYDPYR